jgi:hypothetical protein
MGAKISLYRKHRPVANYFHSGLLGGSLTCHYFYFVVYINYHLMKISSLALA